MIILAHKIPEIVSLSVAGRLKFQPSFAVLIAQKCSLLMVLMYCIRLLNVFWNDENGRLSLTIQQCIS